jgi:hypothetical protein
MNHIFHLRGTDREPLLKDNPYKLKMSMEEEQEIFHSIMKDKLHNSN